MVAEKGKVLAIWQLDFVFRAVPAEYVLRLPLFVGVSAPRRYMRDEGRPLGAGLQEQAPNHLKLHWSKAIVVSVMEKAGQDLVR